MTASAEVIAGETIDMSVMTEGAMTEGADTTTMTDMRAMIGGDTKHASWRWSQADSLRGTKQSFLGLACGLRDIFVWVEISGLGHEVMMAQPGTRYLCRIL